TNESWQSMSERQREAVNRAILNFDPDYEEDEKQLRAGAQKWWNLSSEAAQNLVEAWKDRPHPDRRVNLSRRALKNLLPYLRKGLTLSEARQAFARQPESAATPAQRARYALSASTLRRHDRHFLQKHPDLLPPAPILSNPVVRKAIFEVRRH